MSRYSDADYEQAIEEMMGMPRYIADFICDGADLDAVVRLLLSRGLPLRDRTASDDRLIDKYDEQITALRDAFTKFAHEGNRVDKFIDYQLEHAA